MRMKHTLIDGRIDNRNYGIDALRLFAMFLVTVLHTLGHGGVIDNTVGIRNDVVSLVRIIAYCAVDCYAIISGFVAYSDNEKPYKYSKYITMWLQVLLYSFGFSFLFFIITDNTVSVMNLLKSAIPVTTNQYWYFSAYTGLFFVIPWLNKFARALTKKEITIAVIISFIVFSCYGRILDPFKLNNGSSFIWLAILYLFGAWLKKCDIIEKIKSRYVIIVLGFCVLITWLFKIFSPVADDLFISYVSPTIVLSALCWVVVFSKLKLGKKAQGIIKFLSPAAFGVYLIQEQLNLKRTFISEKFIWISELEWWLIPVAVLGCAFTIFVICLIIERIRLSLFNVLKINKTAEKICYKLELFLRKYINKICDHVSD